MDGLVVRPVGLPARSHNAVGLRLLGARHRLGGPDSAESDVRMDGGDRNRRHHRMVGPADQRGVLQRQGLLPPGRTMAGVPPGRHRRAPHQRLRAVAPTRHAVAVHLRPPSRWRGLAGLATPEHPPSRNDPAVGLDGRGEPLRAMAYSRPAVDRDRRPLRCRRLEAGWLAPHPPVGRIHSLRRLRW